MHHTAIVRRGRTRHRVWSTLLCALALLGAAQLAPAALAAATPFNGGPVAADCPTLVANDHTVYALRFVATAGGPATLDPSTTYYVKIRFTPNADGSPAGVENRGFTWRSALTMGATDSGAWVQEREDWSLFPTVTTDATGAITAGTTWYFFKFGDTAKTGTYRILVSLSTGTSGSTRNCDAPIAVSVTDAATASYWVHDGVATGAAAKRVEVVDHATPGLPIALQRTELNKCDDDSNGIVDDEQYGPTKSGGFRVAAPTGQALDVLVQGALWPALSTGFSSATPDVDIALGAPDQTPPSAPGSLSVTPGTTSTTLNWVAASDDTAVTAYEVYRWTDPPSGSGYTNSWQLLATVTSGTSYEDTTATPGITYHYVVRAEDAATNVGPRDPKAVGALTLQASATAVASGGHATLTGELESGGQPLMDNQQVRLESSTDKAAWVLLETLSPAAATDFHYAADVGPAIATYYRLAFVGDETHVSATSPEVKVAPRVQLGTPVAPSTVQKGKTFTVYGSLKPRHTVGRTFVIVKCYLKTNAKWVFKRQFGAKDYNFSTYTRYKASFALSARGVWKLVASYAATTKYATTASGAVFLRVK